MLVRVDKPVVVTAREAVVWYWRFLRDPLQAVIDGCARYGPFFQLPHPRLPTKPRRAFLVAIGPVFNRDVLGNPSAWRPVNIGPGGPKHSAARRLGVGLIRMNGKQHAHYRSLLLPPLHRKAIDASGNKLVSLASETVDNWPLGETIDLWSQVRRLMRTFAIGVLFGDDREHGYPIADMINRATNYNWSWKVAACPMSVPGTPFHRMLRDAVALEKSILAWANIKRGRVDASDLLSIVVNNKDETGCPVNNDTIVGHTPTLFGAAYETCQNAMIWTLVLLDQHPRVARDLYDEVRGLFANGSPDYERLVELPLLDAVVKESMRILPPVPQQFRVAQHDTTINGFGVATSTRVLLSAFLTNREPGLYPDPERFKPERWANISPSAYEYSVFSAGPRGCPGYAFGIAMLKVGIASIISRYRIAFPPGTRLDYKVRVAFSPKNAVPAVLHRQDGAFAASLIDGAIRNLVRFPN